MSLLPIFGACDQARACFLGVACFDSDGVFVVIEQFIVGVSGIRSFGIERYENRDA